MIATATWQYSITSCHRANNHRLLYEFMANGKLHDIKETASDAVEILREIGTPGVQETFDKIREVAIIGRDIMQIMKEPEWQRNIENMRLISQNFNQTSERMDRTMKELKETGIVNEAKGLITTAREKIQSFDTGDNAQGMGMKDIREVTMAIKEMLESIKGVTDELKLTISESRRPGGTIDNLQEASHEVREAISLSNKRPRA